jgi:hypothetical protein
MRTHIISLSLAIVLLCPYASADWVKTNGPYNGNIQCLAVSGTNLFAGAFAIEVVAYGQTSMCVQSERDSLPELFLSSVRWTKRQRFPN